MINPAAPDFTNTPVADGRPRFGYVPASLHSEPVLTIITPFFDADPSEFEKTVRSVRQQSLQQWEWVIVDDCSTRRDSRELLDRCRDADPRIRVVRHAENRGPAAARNTGVKHARSEFILKLDSDDMVEPTFAEKCLWFLESHPEHAFVTGFGVGFGAQNYLWARGFHDNEAFLFENLAVVTSVMRRDAYVSVDGYDETLRDGLEDWEFWLRCAAAGHWGTTIPEYLFWYLRRSGHSERWPDWDGGARQQELLRTWRRRYPQLVSRGFPQIAVSTSEDVELDRLPYENKLAKEKRRLLLIVPWTALGGADKFNLDVIAQLTRRDWEVTVVTTLFGDHQWMSEFTALTPDVFACSHFLQPADYPRFFDYVVRSRQPDGILISNSVYAYKALAHLRRVAGHIPIVDFCHMEQDEWLDGGYPRLSVDGRELIDLRITSSRYLKDWEVRHGADPERVDVCYTNVQPRAPAPRASRSTFGAPEDVPLIVYPARLAAQKQPDVFLKTIRRLRNGGQQRFLALVVGEGPYLSWMKAFVRRNRLGGVVRFLGPRPNTFVAELIAASDVLFLPSKHEGISLSLYEAMAAGVPVVGADVGGQRELVTPDCGVLVRRADEETEVSEYTEALTRLLADDSRREAMGHAARARISAHFTLDEMGDRMEAALERASALVASNPPTVPSAEEARDAAREGVRVVWWDYPHPPSRSQETSGSRYARSYRVRHTLFRALRTVGMPIYELGMRLGLHWLETVKDRIFYALFPRSK